MRWPRSVCCGKPRPPPTELETGMMGWLAKALGLPDRFHGVIQDSASSATLAAVLMMRERALGYEGKPNRPLRCAEVAPLLFGRGAYIHRPSAMGFRDRLRKPCAFAGSGCAPWARPRSRCGRPSLTISRQGTGPAGVILSVGGTSTGATDPVGAAIEVAKNAGLMVHIDAAWAGAAMICPEFRSLWAGVEAADSVVFNPHKWLGAQFDCSAHFVAEPDALRKTLAISPEYLKTHGKDDIINYSEWSIALRPPLSCPEAVVFAAVRGVRGPACNDSKPCGLVHGALRAVAGLRLD